MDRDQARRGGALRPFADPADMAGIAQRNCGKAGRLGFFNADVDGDRRDRLTEAEAAVEDADDRRIDKAFDRLVGNELARADPIDVTRHADHAVAVVAGEIGVDQRRGDAARFFRAAADASENLGAEVGQGVGGNVNRHVGVLDCGRRDERPGFARSSAIVLVVAEARVLRAAAPVVRKLAEFGRALQAGAAPPGGAREAPNSPQRRRGSRFGFGAGRPDRLGPGFVRGASGFVNRKAGEGMSVIEPRRIARRSEPMFNAPLVVLGLIAVLIAIYAAINWAPDGGPGPVIRGLRLRSRPADHLDLAASG